MLETGASQTRLTNNTTDDVSPASSPDGTLVVFSSDRDDPNQATCEATHACQYELYTMNATDGTNQTNVSNDVPFNDASPDWQSVTSLVSVVDFAYVPSTIKGSLGGTIMFDFFGPSDHTVTDNSGMGLFDSGIKVKDSFFLYTFRFSGQFPIVCTIHPTQMTGNVKVPMNVTPPSGTVTTVFTISWATATQSMQSPYRYDVQILRPGSGSFVPWKTGVTQRKGTFTPDAGTGQYLFQARIRNTGNGFSSVYSAPRAITVS